MVSDHHKLLVTCLTPDCPPHHAFQCVQQIIMLNRMEDEPSLVADPEATTRPLLQNGPALRLHCQFRCSVSRRFKVVPLVTADNRLARLFLIHQYTFYTITYFLATFNIHIFIILNYFYVHPVSNMGSHIAWYALIVHHISDCWPEDGLTRPKHVATIKY